MAFNLPIKKQAAPGQRVELIKMDDPYSKLKPGTQGTVEHIDNTGTVFVNWDTGSKLGLIPDVDEYRMLSEDEDRNFRPFSRNRNTQIGDRNQELYRQAEEELIGEDGGEETEDTMTDVEEEDPFEGKERRFRASIYVDVHVPMTADLEADRETAEQEASEVLKKLNNKFISNAYIGGIADNPFGKMPDHQEFDRL